VTYHFGEDFFSGKDGISTVGEELGMHMALKCPELFTEFFDYSSNENEIVYQSISGRLNKIKKDEFLTFIVKEPSGKSHEFMLLNSFETSYLLTDDILKTNDEIEVYYYVSEIYNAKINRYVNYNIVTYIEKK